MGNQTQRPSGSAGVAGKRGGMRILIASIGSSGVGKNTTTSSWNRTGALKGNRDGERLVGAHFSSARNKVKQQWLITGVTKDSTGAVLGNCQVVLFKTVDNMPTAITTSDDSGNYTFSIDGNSQTRFAVSYKDGGTPVTGATLNTLVPVLT